MRLRALARSWNPVSVHSQCNSRLWVLRLSCKRARNSSSWRNRTSTSHISNGCSSKLGRRRCSSFKRALARALVPRWAAHRPMRGRPLIRQRRLIRGCRDWDWQHLLPQCLLLAGLLWAGLDFLNFSRPPAAALTKPMAAALTAISSAMRCVWPGKCVKAWRGAACQARASGLPNIWVIRSRPLYQLRKWQWARALPARRGLCRRRR